MKKYIDVDKLKSEIERRYAEYRAKMKTDDFAYYGGMADALDLFEQFIDTLSEEPDKSLEETAEMDLEREIEWEWLHREKQEVDLIECAEMDKETFVRFARHFYELGQRDAANKFDEIEYNRQRAEEEMSDKTLDEAAHEYACTKSPYGANAFKAGAKWMAEQGEVQEHFVIGHTEESQGHPVIVCYPESFGIGDKVIVQIRKKEENK